MAEVLRWPRRLPLVALADRRRVMQTWKDACGGKIPTECAIPFAEVRSLSPEAFIELLANELKVGGVAVGSNYRFGYKAAGDAALLRTLAAQHGMKVAIVDLVEHDGELVGDVVSSSWVREALAEGDVAAAGYALGRPYRLVMGNNVINNVLGSSTENSTSSTTSGSASKEGAAESNGSTQKGSSGRLGENPLFYPSSALANQPPARGRYEVLAHVVPPGADMPHINEGATGIVIITESGVELGEGLVNLRVPPDSQLAVDFITLS